jgi:hypothetical protein
MGTCTDQMVNYETTGNPAATFQFQRVKAASNVTCADLSAANNTYAHLEVPNILKFPAGHCPNS